MTVPAEVLGGRYRLEERLAVGGMGEVWRARDELLGRAVAVKLLRTEYADDPEFLDRFRTEARHTASLSSPGIASIYDYGEVNERGVPAAYLVMELVEGEPLSDLLARGGRLAPARTMDIVGQVALALQVAHDAGIVHRDVKPGNLMLRPDGVVKVTDFGIARAMDAAGQTSSGVLAGTAYYVSPEQVEGRQLTPASDLYALGAVAFECLAGRRPFEGATPLEVSRAHVQQPTPELPDDIPAPVRALVSAALAKDPANRPASAGLLGREALALAGAEPAAAPADGGTSSRRNARPGAGTGSGTGDRPASGGLRRWRGPLLVVLLFLVLAVTLLLRSCDARGTAGSDGAGHNRVTPAAKGVAPGAGAGSVRGVTPSGPAPRA